MAYVSRFTIASCMDLNWVPTKKGWMLLFLIYIRNAKSFVFSSFGQSSLYDLIIEGLQRCKQDVHGFLR